jgi:glucokinase
MAHSAKFVIGIDLGGTRTKIGLIDRQGRTLLFRTFPTRLDLGRDQSLKGFILNVHSFLTLSQKKGAAGALIGLGVPGTIGREEGIIRLSPNFPEWKDVPIARIINDSTMLPVFVDNDANVVPYAEKWVGAAKDLNHFACLTLGTGLGSGFFLNGQPWTGGLGNGPEFGHITVHPQGLRCGCGNRGCLETLVAAPYLVKKAQQSLKHQTSPYLTQTLAKGSKTISAHVLFQGARQKDPYCISLFAEMGRFLGRAIAGLVHVLGLEGIILGGGVSRASTIFLPYLQKEFNKRLTMIDPKTVLLAVSPLGDKSGILGAAKMALDRSGEWNKYLLHSENIKR